MRWVSKTFQNGVLDSEINDISLANIDQWSRVDVSSSNYNWDVSSINTDEVDTLGEHFSTFEELRASIGV